MKDKHALETFCNSILQLNHPDRYDAHIVRPLHEATVAFARAYLDGDETEYRAAATALEGAILVCESVEYITGQDTERLLDQLYDLLSPEDSRDDLR